MKKKGIILKIISGFNRKKKKQQREAIKEYVESLYRHVRRLHDKVGWNRDPFLDAMVREFYGLYHACRVVSRSDYEACVDDLEYMHTLIRDYLHIKKKFFDIQDQRFNRQKGIEEI